MNARLPRLSRAGGRRLTVQPHEVPGNPAVQRRRRAALPAFIEGRVTVQDAASALAAAVADPKPGGTVLDRCGPAAELPWLKMQGKGNVTSCDIYEHKLKRIRDGAARLGLPNIRTELQDASVCREEWKDSADVVLCDVPCSGLGIIRKKPEIRFKNPDEIRTLPEIQARILANCAQYVKKGGTLVYSTCTILQRENEDVVRAFLTENPEFEAVSWTHPVCGERADGMVTLLPPVHNTDGFFIAKMHRKV
ncbi:MAG: hypothetical protein ACLRVN_06660 [Butyricicoccus sp.]